MGLSVLRRSAHHSKNINMSLDSESETSMSIAVEKDRQDRLNTLKEKLKMMYGVGFAMFSEKVQASVFTRDTSIS